jgi:hypothetical protein
MEPDRIDKKQKEGKGFSKIKKIVGSNERRMNVMRRDR